MRTRQMAMCLAQEVGEAIMLGSLLNLRNRILDLDFGFWILESYFFKPEPHSILRLFSTTVSPLGNTATVPVRLSQCHSVTVSQWPRRSDQSHHRLAVFLRRLNEI